jgi:integrase
VASYRRLESGKHQATVLLPIRLPNGRQKRATKTHPSKVVVREWATKLEADIDAGRFVDPRAGNVTLRDHYARWSRSRVAADATNAKTGSFWRTHIDRAWGGHPLATITKAGLRGWVKRMAEEECPACYATPGTSRSGVLVRHDDRAGRSCRGAGQPAGLGAWTIQGVVRTLSSIMAGAADDGLIAANPVPGLTLPRVDAKPVFFWTKADAARLVEALNGHGLMCDLDLHVGLRWGELAGLRRRYVDVEHGLIHVVGVETRTGWREYPKSKMSRRPVPIPLHLRDQLGAVCAGLAGDDYVFAAPEGGPWDDTNFRRRVFGPAVKAAGVPTGTPHDMRHTAASWLVQAGVDLYRVQALLGHEKPTTTQRYAHLAPDAFDRIIEAWS